MMMHLRSYHGEVRFEVRLRAGEGFVRGPEEEREEEDGEEGVGDVVHLVPVRRCQREDSVMGIAGKTFRKEYQFELWTQEAGGERARGKEAYVDSKSSTVSLKTSVLIPAFETCN
jgi:hypothetical protein